ISVTIHHDAASDSMAVSTGKVSDPAVIAVGGVSVSGVEGVAEPDEVVATFTDPGGAEDLSHYSADIAWGDGASSQGEITFDSTSNVFSISGGHLYADEGTFVITTTIHHDAAPDATATSSASVADPPVVATGDLTITAVE